MICLLPLSVWTIAQYHQSGNGPPKDRLSIPLQSVQFKVFLKVSLEITPLPTFQKEFVVLSMSVASIKNPSSLRLTVLLLIVNNFSFFQ